MWVEVGTVAEVRRARKKLVEVDGRQIAVFWHRDGIYALDNVCIHKQRELVRGVILGDRIVCPGHQWAYDLETGWCRERDRYQPRHAVRVEGDVVLVDTTPQVAESEKGAGSWPRTSS